MSETVLDDTLSPDYFRRCLADAGQFTDQNERYEQLNTDPTFDDPDLNEFRQIGNDALYLEQLDTRDALLAQDLSPYTAITEAHAAKTAELQAAEARLVSISDQEDARKTRLLAAARRVTELAPYASSDADNLAHQKIEAIEQLDRAGLRERIGALSTELAQLDEAFHVSGEAWPVPLVIRDYDLAQQPKQPEVEEIITEDEIPVDPEMHTTNETARKLIERHGQTHRASALLAAYLIQHPNTIFMPQQLGAFLYTDESHFAGMGEYERDRCISGRIRRLLNPDSLAPQMLSEEGHQLQYGWRHYIHSETGKAVQRKRRIYRVIPLSAQPDALGTFEETVHPDIQPEADMPPVAPVPRAERPPLAAEAPDKEEQAFAAHVRETIEQLWALDLLPDQVDDTLTVRAFMHTKVLQVPRADRSLRVVKALKAKAEAAQPNNKTDATDIVLSAIDAPFRPKMGSEKDIRRVRIAISSMLETFYESLAA